MTDFKKSTILRGLLVALTFSIFLTGCASTLPPVEEPAKRPVDEFVREDVVYTIDIYDPIEGFNRGVYKFNYYFDKYVFLPVVNVYQFFVPKFFQRRVSSFVDNVFEFNNLTNSLLQLEFKKAGITVSRFAVNTTFGVLGTFDTASEMGLQRQNEDFGQTLGHYGVGHGPFIMLPIVGPSNLRDTTGLVTDAVAFSLLGPPAWVDDDDLTLAFNITTAVDARSREQFRYFETGTPFEYDLVRMLYTKKRELDIAR
jgi:phospholipid-binding lipoprotein MlaA